MNIHYISGFFDADGYLTMGKNGKEEHVPYAGFTNNIREILEEIQCFLFENFSIKGHISKKTARKETHHDSYDLKYSGFKTCGILKNILCLKHPKKIARFEILQSIHDLTNRGGKYSEQMLKDRRNRCEDFFKIL